MKDISTIYVILAEIIGTFAKISAVFRFPSIPGNNELSNILHE